MKAARILVAGMLCAGLGACSTWDSLSRAEKGAAVGAAGGAVVGGMATDSTLGTLGGAAVGGVVGHEVGKRQDRR